MEVIVRDIDFLNCGTVPTTANGSRFSASITGVAPPTVAYANGSGLLWEAVQLALTNASQAQVASLFQNDNLESASTSSSERSSWFGARPLLMRPKSRSLGVWRRLATMMLMRLPIRFFST